MTITVPRREHAGGAVDAALGGLINTTATSFTITPDTGWPTGAIGDFEVLIDPDTATEEKILCSDLSAGTITVSGGVAGRGHDGTTAHTHQAGAVVRHIGPSAEELDLLNSVLALFVAKGLLVVGDGTGAVSLTAGANHTLPIYDSTQAKGFRQALIDTLEIANNAITPALLASSVAGNGMTGGAGSALDVVSADASLTVSANSIQIPSGQKPTFIGTSHPGSPAEGWISIRTDLNRVYLYDGSAWQLIDYYGTPGAGVGAPSFKASRSTAQPITTGVVTSLTYPTETTDTDNGFTAAGSVYTIPTGMGGLWTFQANASWVSTPGSGSIYWWTKNGVRRNAVANAGDSEVGTSWTARFAAGDTVGTQVYQVLSPTLNVSAADFEGQWLRP